MCDYSLHGIQNRLAAEGEVLVLHRFYTGSKGLTSPEYLKPTEQQKKGLIAMLIRMLAFPAEPRVCAVCIPDGARLMLHGISPALRQAHGLSTTEAVTFRQLSTDAHTYRDAVEFKNGVKIRLQDLEEGQSVEVVAISSEKAGVQREVHSRRCEVWHTGSPDMRDGSLAMPEELGNFYSDRAWTWRSQIVIRGLGR